VGQPYKKQCGDLIKKQRVKSIAAHPDLKKRKKRTTILELRKNPYILKELVGFDDIERRGVENFLSECFFDLGWEYSEYDQTEDGKIFDGISYEKAKFWRLFDGNTLVGTVAVREIADTIPKPNKKNDVETPKPNKENDGKTPNPNETEKIKTADKDDKLNEKSDVETPNPNEVKGKKICELKRFYVKKGYQGKGLGRFLMKTALSYAKDAGYDVIRADTESVCKSSIHLMEASGFYQIPSYNENIFAELFYELSLKS
jgi:ribosomal protein S18 acetylase RimI-like enzyme